MIFDINLSNFQVNGSRVQANIATAPNKSINKNDFFLVNTIIPFDEKINEWNIVKKNKRFR